MAKRYNKTFIWIGCIILVLLLYMPIFGHLESMPIRLWDESRLAISAYEMYKNGHVMVPHYEGSPEMWSTKPPLMLWCQAFFMKIFSPGELAVRLPSALSAFFTCCFLVFFSTKYLKNFWLGFITVLILIISEEYVRLHGTRTGDYDAMLALFTTVSYLCFFIFLENGKRKYLYSFFIGLSLAVLTKSVTGLMFLPGLLIYVVWQKKILTLFKNKEFYIGLGSFIFIVAGYYLTREALNPGYLKAVSENELGGRFLDKAPAVKTEFCYFFDKLIESRWIYLIPCGLLVGFFNKNKQIVRLSVFSFVLSFTFLLIISISVTRLSWYDMPIIPFFSIIAGIFFWSIFHVIEKIPSYQHNLSVNILPFVFLFLCFYQPYKIVFDQTNSPKEPFPWDEESYQIGYFLKDAVKGKKNVSGFIFLENGYDPQNQFYINILNDKGASIQKNHYSNLKVGDRVIAYTNEHKEYLEEHFSYEIILTDRNVFLYNIISEKE